MPIDTIFESDLCKWIDVTAPTKEDLDSLHHQFHINKLHLDDTVDPSHLPKFEEVEGVKFFLTRENVELQRKNLNGINDVSTKLGIFIIEKIIITIHRTDNKSILEIKEDLNKNPDKYKKYSPDKLALILGLKIMKSFDDESKKLIEIIDKLETEIFMQNSPQLNPIKKLYKIKRKAGLNARVLNMSSDWIGAFKKLNLKDIEIADLVDKQKDVMSDFDHISAQITNLISVYIALSDQKANQVMKLLAMYSVYFLPITFIAGLYGMNFEFMPELHHKYGYFATLGVMLSIIIATFIYFKKKKF
ncbi:magnesium transporter CorA family protein [Riemerella anatipestifer]|uniref:Magnesium transporter CorA n=1 Tax=Riemerella anatipestifer TaxID=34085 RepID=A0AAP3AM85_RIEAN|nr:CorA family divalent cation transporter [Riemerella anatipestifer]AZZ59531.1 magnesium transporter CorA [Riemerella anatipestifer]MBT0526868.1 magnesium transporter CorA [Riemerella anatipestifer]MBT0528853.1 magnesium transporter CorA [Riemerella anatipestifer]MBT0530746.1 magnesium transporter CorA [Riemerella anatipestifer]MBT0532666.1 magnesium transporter CorA [Riemerella anatipestifer]